MYERRKIMTKFKTQTRWIAIASAAVAAVVLSGCATSYSGAQRLERWEAGETKDLMLVRGVHNLDSSIFKSECDENKVGATTVGAVNISEWIGFFSEHVCASKDQWQRYSGFIKSDFGKGAIYGRGLIRPGMRIDVDDIIEVSQRIDKDGRISSPAVAIRVIRKNALKERDPTCYWDGQSGRFDSFATGGVVCPAEGWDWRDQKWSKK
jgi:hypothetical protein